jgi:Domain of unknown function (DUF4389)
MSSTAYPAPHPIELTVTGDLARSRVTVFFRYLLVLPHAIVVYFWRILAALTAIVAWPIALVIGRVPGPLHRFLSAYVRYSTRVAAYVLLIADPYPPFSGAEGRGVVDVAIDPAAPQNRWKILFRLLLFVPAWFLVSTFQIVSFMLAFLGWFYCLVTGRMEPGMQKLNALLLRYQVQADGYMHLLTDRYPRL